jgi:hypothetical protein
MLLFYQVHVVLQRVQKCLQQNVIRKFSLDMQKKRMFIEILKRNV